MAKYWVDLETLSIKADSCEESKKKAKAWLMKNVPDIINVEAYDHSNKEAS